MVKCSMDDNGRDGAADGPVVSEGGRSPSTPSIGHAAPPMQSGAKLAPLAPGQRWSAARKREVVLRLLRGESAVVRPVAETADCAVQAAKGRLAGGH